MIHYFPRFARNAADTPFGDALRAIGAPHRIFAAALQQTYRSRAALLLLGYPTLAWAALVNAWRSLHSRPPPDAVVISSDVEALMFALVRALPGSAKAPIVFMPFIFTTRLSGILNRLRLAYYRLVMRRVRLAICHSELEIGRYQAMFAGCGTSFAFVPWGTHVPSPAEILAGAGPLPEPGGPPRIVSAGRSGRDYPALAAATRDLPCHVTLICNETVGLQGVEPGPNLEILRDCFGLAYLRQLLGAEIVAVPLRIADISAGQMVIIQAMALARPLVVTDTPTIGDYLVHDETALLVPRGDTRALRAAIQRLLDDPSLAARLGQAAQRVAQTRFSTEAHMRLVVQAVQRFTHTS